MENSDVGIDRTFDVLIIGGGNAGISAAALLKRRGVTDVAVIEPQKVHTYRPLLSYVSGGQATLSDAERTQRSVTPKGCTWLADSAAFVDAPARTVTCESGRKYRYRDLVLGPGLVPDTEELARIDDTLDSAKATSNYVDTAGKTWDLVQAMPSRGHAVFTVPRSPVSCTGTTVKPLFLAAAHWRRTGRIPGVSITLVIDRPQLLGVPELDERLNTLFAELGVVVHYDTNVAELNPDDDNITVGHRDGTTQQLHYDLLHLVPPFRGPRWLEESKLTGDDSNGLVDIDPQTLRHRSYDDIWAAGDGAALDTDPSGGSLRKQIAVLVDNLLAARSGGDMAAFDGYTVAPVAIDNHKLIAGEFDRTGSISSSVPSFLDPLKPRRTAWAFDRYVLPRVYWNLILRGYL
ncbi:NAD(P)/FAD-dependent oxidoreductase [Antrihabitans sp. YC3-6]|uniref:NAD(P)/FAD-dependent oxidoreductase n=1 Tax=Antrihabitans stalagmiti TaxID=2799499 RepID=A0A934NM61_9NOCA|nr:FAD/NAD(P)-binding oxidoreductase [Antrihabitans stalagmiti]MBJ8337778.1 NAD(P)/FAD-dependent oxidoreductase [Antrihabitans stalagmiti]